MSVATEFKIDNVRGYGSAVVDRLLQAIEQDTPLRPDPGHPHLFFLEAGRDNFYIAPLCTGTIVLLAHWMAD